MLARKMRPAGARISPHCPYAWLSPVVATRVWMYVLGLGIIFYCWEASFAVLPLYENRNHSWLFRSCLMCCEGSQDLYTCPGTTKPLHELLLPWMHEFVWRVEPLGGETAARHTRVWQSGHHCSAAGAGAESNPTLCSVLCPVSFKDLLGCKKLLLYFDG